MLDISSAAFVVSDAELRDVLYCPAGVNNKLPSGANVNRRKNEDTASFPYILALRTPKPTKGLGEAEGMTAGSGMEGAGDAERRKDGEAFPMDDLLL